MSKTDNQLRAEVSTNETRAEWGAWAVVLGLLLEVIFSALFPVGKTWVEHWGAIVADSFVALGVYIEIHFGRKASAASADLRQLLDLKVAELNQETARLRAKEPLVEEALLANAYAGRASALAAAAIRTVTEQIAFEQGLVTRAGLSEAAKSLLIIPRISPFAGKQFVAVGKSRDGELETLLHFLRQALISAGWIEVDRSDIGAIHRELSSVGGPGLVEIHMDASRNPELLNAAEALASALNAEGIAATVNPKTETDTGNTNVINILIGPKNVQ
jgi:hypothetical protein